MQCSQSASCDLDLRFKRFDHGATRAAADATKQQASALSAVRGGFRFRVQWRDYNAHHPLCFGGGIGLMLIPLFRLIVR